MDKSRLTFFRQLLDTPSPSGFETLRPRGTKSMSAFTCKFSVSPVNSARLRLLRMKVGLSPLRIGLKVTARDSPVLAGSPRELIAVASGSPRNTQESGTTPRY